MKDYSVILGDKFGKVINYQKENNYQDSTSFFIFDKKAPNKI